MNSYYLVQIYATVVWINTKVAWNHTIKLWNLGSKMFPKNSVRHWMMECETFFSISALLALLLIKTSENYFLSGPTRYEFILHWYEFIPAWYIFMLRGLFWHNDRVFCCSTLKPASISVKVAVMIITIISVWHGHYTRLRISAIPWPLIRRRNQNWELNINKSDHHEKYINSSGKRARNVLYYLWMHEIRV